MGRASSMHGARSMYKILVRKLKGRDHSENWALLGRKYLGKEGGKLWTGCIWLMKGTSSRLLRTR
jgi:hypothetical protein